MIKITATSLKTGETREYLMPSLGAALRHAKMTDGMQFDHVERKNISGGLPMVWQQA